jgi:GNAT superfamily N-acetyltransferase
MWLSVGDQETESGVAHPPTDLFQAVSQIEGVERAARRFEGLGATVRHHVYEGGHGIAWFREGLSPALRWLVGNSRHAIRPFRDEDEEAVVRIWHRSGKAAYDFLPLWQSLTLDRAAAVFSEVIAGKCDLWVGTLDARIVAFLAMNDSYIDRMYVDPDHWHEGWGTRLLDFAKSRSPQGLELHTHQGNHIARQFYEKHGFKAVKFGISPSPESAPDVEYHWRATAP